MFYIMIIIDDIVAPPQLENGVKQGGVLSPTLFCIYFDELLRRLRETDVGCHVVHMSYAAFGYADDLLLLSPIHGLEILVKTSEYFASEQNQNKTRTKPVLKMVLQSGNQNPRWPTKWPLQYLYFNLDGLEKNLILFCMGYQGMQNHT